MNPIRSPASAAGRPATRSAVLVTLDVVPLVQESMRHRPGGRADADGDEALQDVTS